MTCAAPTSGSIPAILLFPGLFFAPEAFVTATRQAVAQAKGWSLDEMRLDIDVLAGGTPGDGAGAGPDGVQTFLIKGLHLQGAGWGLGALSLSDDVRTPLATCRFRWRRETEAESGGGGGDGAGAVSVPVYLNEGRTELLFQVRDRTPPEFTSDGVALEYPCDPLCTNRNAIARRLLEAWLDAEVHGCLEAEDCRADEWQRVPQQRVERCRAL